MKIQPSIATRCQRDVLRTERDDPFDVRIVFLDQSVFAFHAVTGNSSPTVTGDPGSLAVLLRSQAKAFTYLAAGVMIKFEDGSSCSLNFGRKIAEQPAPPAPAGIATRLPRVSAG